VGVVTEVGDAADAVTGKGTGAITVLVADDQPLMRSAVRMCLSPEPGITVVGEAGDGREAVALAGRLHPDVVIMDIRMPTVDGIAATKELTAPREGRQTRVLVLTTFELDEYIVEGLRAGASGFLLKDATPAELVYAVRVVAGGEALLAPRVTRRLLDLHARHLPPARRATSVLAALTPREDTILRLVATGQSNAEIARSLCLAESSVKSHIGHLLGKLGVPDRVHLVIFAYDHGLTWQQPAW